MARRLEGPQTPPSWDALAARALAAGRAGGLHALGITTGEPLLRARSILHERKAAGLSAQMAFTYNKPNRSTDPSATLRNCRAIVVGAYSYRREDPVAPAESSARIARYAQVDHYVRLRQGLGAVADVLRAAGWKAMVVADENALVDREVAWRAGLGWFGKNANLLLPGEGSWFVLGSVLTTALLPPAAAPVADGCGSCTRCLPACPTNAIVAPGVVDARRCLAWLVQAPGDFPEEHRVALGDRLYGCDDCQEACPPNRTMERRGVAPAETGTQAWVPIVAKLQATDAELLAEFDRFYIAGRDPAILRRNLLVALGNVGDAADPGVVEALNSHARHANPIVRSHAKWAAERLGCVAASSLDK